ncbi:MAG: universal stress protein [Solirubrobacterales bacterium]
MFKNVLVGIDGKPNGRDAIALASRLLDDGGKMALAHVHSADLRVLQTIGPELLAEEVVSSEELLRNERAEAGVDAELITVTAPTPGRGLHEQAEAQGADLIVVGSCSRGLLGRVMLGDDTRAALNGTPCAVAVAARGYATASTPLMRIGVGYDGSPESIAALAAAREIAGESKGSVSALQIVTIPPVMYTGLMPPLVGESIDSLIEEARGRMEGMPDVEGRAVYGVPGEELSAFGDELELLVVGSRSFGPVRRRVVGSTCDYLERHARCSLLTLPRVGAADSSDGRPGSTAVVAV